MDFIETSVHTRKPTRFTSIHSHDRFTSSAILNWICQIHFSLDIRAAFDALFYFNWFYISRVTVPHGGVVDIIAWMKGKIDAKRAGDKNQITVHQTTVNCLFHVSFFLFLSLAIRPWKYTLFTPFISIFSFRSYGINSSNFNVFGFSALLNRFAYFIDRSLCCGCLSWLPVKCTWNLEITTFRIVFIEFVMISENEFHSAKCA